MNTSSYTRKKFGGSTETQATYPYTKVGSAEPIRSGQLNRDKRATSANGLVLAQRVEEGM